MLPCQHISQSSLVKFKVTHNRLSTDTMFAHHRVGVQAKRDPMFAIISAGFAIGPRDSCLLTSTRASAHIVWHTSKKDCSAYLISQKNIFKCKSVELGSAHNLTRQHCRLNICCYIGWTDKYWDGGSKPSQGPVEFSKGHNSKRSALRRILLVK